MTADELEAAIAEAREAITTATDPSAAASRLLRWAKRERHFNLSPAAMTDGEIVTARLAGLSPQRYATGRRFVCG